MRDGVYTPAQAKHGEALYKQECAPCYGDALEGNNQTERAQRLERAPRFQAFFWAIGTVVLYRISSTR